MPVIMGIDPGSVHTGYGIIRTIGPRSEYVAGGVINPPAGARHSKRLLVVYDRLLELMISHQPDALVVESLFHGNNSQSLIKLSQIRGAALLAGEKNALDIYEYAPREVKKGVTGFGGADKPQMVFMVAKMLSLPDLRSKDEADALALALYHAGISRFHAVTQTAAACGAATTGRVKKL